MIDWLMTKATMIIVAMIVLVSMLGFFSVQRSLIEKKDLQNIADQISSWVNKLNTIHTNLQVNITYNKSKLGYHLPETISRGKFFTIQFLNR